MKGKRGPRPTPFGATRKPKHGKTPDKARATVTRKLSETEINERSRRLAAKQVALDLLEARKQSLTKDLNGDIKAARAEVKALAKQIVEGLERLPQGDLFADGSTKESKTLPPAVAHKGLAEVAKHVDPAATPAAGDGKGKGPAATA